MFSPVILQPYIAGGFSPTDLPTLALWLDSTDSSTITEIAGGVDQWNDKSSNGNNFSAPTASNRPQISGSDINFVKASVDYLVADSDIVLTGEFCISFVLSNSETTGNRFYLGRDAGGTNKLGMVGSDLFLRVTNGTDAHFETFPFGTDELGIITITRDSNDKIDLYINDGSPTRLFSDATRPGSVTWSRIGRDEVSNFYGGLINTAQITESAADAVQLIAFNKKKYGI